MSNRIGNLMVLIKPKRRWAQFSLGSMFIFVTLFCVWLAVEADRRRPVTVTFDQLRIENGVGPGFTTTADVEFAKRLDGKRVRIRGYIWSRSVYAKSFSSFALVEDSVRDWSGNINVHDVIVVHLRQPHVLEKFGDIDKRIVMEGTFAFDPKVYELRDASFVPRDHQLAAAR